MKTGTNAFIVMVGFVVIYACSMKQTNDIKKAEWLIGTWENKTTRGSIYETWDKINNNEFSGISFIVKGQDTVVFETIKLVQEQNGLFYIPTVKNQNDGLPVRFAAKSISETQMFFENPEHDFPQIISYTQITSDSLVAEISGTVQGQERKQTFPMKRVN